MNTHPSSTKHWLSATVGAASLFAVGSAHAVFMSVINDTAEAPGVLLAPGTAGLTGTLVDSLEIPFSSTIPVSPAYTGILRSMVVDRGGGAGYDFYYQVINTSVAGVNDGYDIFRLAIPGYGDDTAFTVDATYLSDGVASVIAVGAPIGFSSTFLPNKVGAAAEVYSADRDVAMDTADFFGGGAAFDFDNTQNFNVNVPGGPNSADQNINAGENSNWLVLRTNYTSYSIIPVITQITGGAGTGLAFAFAPIPEPSTVLFGLAMFGVCAGGRLRKARSLPQA